MSKPIIDKAEVSIDFPDKYYHGSFSHSCRYDVKVDEDGVHITLDQSGGEQRHVAFHLHHHLFSGILESMADQITDKNGLSDLHRDLLNDAATKLAQAAKR